VTVRWIDAAAGLADFARPAAGLVAAAGAIPAATLHEAAGQRGALPSAIKPLAASMRLTGPAFTVQSPPKDNLWLHRALALARPGDVLVVEVGGVYEAGYWGDVMTNAARAGKLGGLVIDGCVRDGERLVELGFPVFARGLCIRGTGKDRSARGALAGAVRIGDAVVRAGDLIVADADGVVALAPEDIEAAVAAARQREAKEERIISELAGGKTTLDLLGLD